jgi:hypothetical protein
MSGVVMALRTSECFMAILSIKAVAEKVLK